jgi:hypothetical protein
MKFLLVVDVMESRSMIGVVEKCNRRIDYTVPPFAIVIDYLAPSALESTDGKSNWWIDQRLDLWRRRRGDNAPHAISR